MLKKFNRKIVLFIVPVLVLFSSGIFLPATPKASGSLLFALKHKDSLLQNVKEPRIIFVGGSNLSFGLNSYKVKDSLNLYPINTAVHAALGLKYMLTNTLQYIQKGDVIIVSPEYYHFFQPYDHSSEQLFRAVFDVDKSKIELLSARQLIKLLGHLPKYSLSKFKPNEYFFFNESEYYGVNSFNKYGDVDAHWEINETKYFPKKIEGDFNEEVMIKLSEFEKAARDKGATVYVSFPCLDEFSFKKSINEIAIVEKKFHKYDFRVLGKAVDYKMSVDMIFDSRYHLNKRGLDHRTDLILRDFKIEMKNK